MLSQRLHLSTLVVGVLGSLATTAGAQSPVTSTDVLERLGVAEAVRQDLELPARAGAPFSTQLFVDGALRAVELRPHSVRAESFKLVVQDDDGYHEVEPAPPATYRGRVEGYDKSFVSASLIDGHLSGVLRLTPESEMFGISPMWRYDAAAPVGAHLIYEQKDLIPDGGTCIEIDASGGQQIEPKTPPVALGSGLQYAAQLGVDSDYEWYQDHGSSVPNAQAALETAVNDTSGVFENDFGLTYEVTHLIVRSTSNDPYTTNDASGLLGQFRSHWLSAQSGVQRDVAHLFTGRNLAGSTIGIAYLNSICNISLHYGLSENRGSDLAQLDLTAHELGHNWSAGHCNGLSGCQIMCSGCGSFYTSFGPNASNSIQNKINSVGCLSPPTSPDPPTISSVNPTTVDAFFTDTMTIQGTNFGGATSVNIGPVSLTDTEFDVVTSNLIEINGFLAGQLGQNAVSVTNLGGTSNSIQITVEETSPPVLVTPSSVLPNFPSAFEYAGAPGDIYWTSWSFSPTTVAVPPYDVLADANLLWTGTLNAAGTGSDVIVTTSFFGFLTFYLQMVTIDPITLNLTGASDVSSVLAF